MGAAELADLLESLYGGYTHAHGVIDASDEGEAPLRAELLVAGAAVVRRHAIPVVAPNNRAVIGFDVAGSRPEGHFDPTVGAAILVAACDGTVAQHDFLPARPGTEALVDALGLPVHATPAAAHDALEQCGFAWLPGAGFHPALHAQGSAFSGITSLLALLGPLVNPASPRSHFVGVSDPALTEPMARALGMMGADAALVVTSDGHPYLRPDADTIGHRWSEGRLSTFHHPAGGRPLGPLPSGTATVDAARLEAVFEGLRGPLADTVALNAGAALWVAGVLPTFDDARRWARSRLGQTVDLADFYPVTPVISPARTGSGADATSRRSPHLPRGGSRRAKDRRG